jgi:hypothetical protein
MTKPRSTTGRAAKKAGDSFEARLNAMHAIYKREGLAYIDQLHPKKVGGFGKTPMRHIGSAPIDFMGILHSGIGIAIEAKNMAGTSLPYGVMKGSGVGIAQLQALDLFAQFGGVSLIAWWRPSEQRMGIAKVGVIGLHPGRSSLPLEAFEWLPPRDFDWLSVLNGGGK